jgi:hypothetical protein
MPKKMDSFTHNEERRALMQAEFADAERAQREIEEKQQLERVEREQVTRDSEVKRLTDEANLLHDITTRDILLERIRKMRDEGKPKEIEYLPLTPDQQARLDKEQADGRAAVARAEALEAANRERWTREEAAERARQATMNPVIHPNPSQTDMYPTTGATLGKRR